MEFLVATSEKAARKVAEMLETRLKLGQPAFPEQAPAGPTGGVLQKVREELSQSGRQTNDQGKLRNQLSPFISFRRLEAFGWEPLCRMDRVFRIYHRPPNGL